MLVMAADVGKKILTTRDGLEHICAKLRMFFIQRELSSRKVGRLGQDLIRQGDEADVMQKPRIADECDLIRRQLHIYGCRSCIVRDADRVVVKRSGFQTQQVCKM